MSAERVSGGIAIPFAEGHDYTRAEISRSVGGPIQPGISTPKRSPLVLIFTGGRGKKFGYKDHWTPEGTFVYTGQGKRGDMEYRLGNRAIEESGRSGKDILLFETQQGRAQRYFGRLRLLRSWREVLPDELGRPRQAILFELLPVGSPPSPKPTAEGRATRLAELRRRAHSEASSNPAQRLRGTTEFERIQAAQIAELERETGETWGRWSEGLSTNQTRIDDPGELWGCAGSCAAHEQEGSP